MLPPEQEENLDILQNIESAIMGIYRQHSEMTDYQVDSALEALGRTYVRNSAVLPKNELAREVYDAMKLTCDWRMGKENVVDEEGQPLSIEPVSTEVILTCLKRVRKSVNYWNKQSGTQGYLNYIAQFML